MSNPSDVKAQTVSIPPALALPQVSSYTAAWPPILDATASAWSKTLPCFFPEKSVFRSVLGVRLPTHYQEPTQLPSLPSTPVPPALFLDSTASIIPPRHSHFPAHPIQSLGVGGREAAKAAARLSGRACI